ncbi:MAG: aminomethyl-transferring glycine dehydrogenase subunit GcvPB [Oscillospiraceae bacterium]
MKLIFERSIPGTGCEVLPACDVPELMPDESIQRTITLPLPELTEGEISRHYSAMERRTHGVNNGFYPLGSCTMKYNPKINNEMAQLPGFADVHPLQPEHTVQGSLKVLQLAEKLLGEITGMDRFTFQPAAGAHGEFTGIAMIKAYHAANGQAGQRTKVLVPDSAHGTNPASAAMNGYKIVSIPSAADGCVDVEALRNAAGPDTAAVMLTNPNTLGLYEKNIEEIINIVHEAGALAYYDGANLNAIMGVVRPGDMGFDVIHLNLHKTFSTPHGGGGPGCGAVGCKNILAPHLPNPVVEQNTQALTFNNLLGSIGKVRGFYGNFLVMLRALCYTLSLGKEGIPAAAKAAVLNANYLKSLLESTGAMAFEGICMHEFVLSMKALKKETGVSALDIAKGLLDYGIHPPTMYFPLIVEEALMFEPTETESKETLEEAAKAVLELIDQSKSDPEKLHSAPHTTVVRRPDEVLAARSPILRYNFTL